VSIVDDLLAAAGLTPRVAVHSLRIRVLIIGPLEAAALLVANRDNRRLRWGRVRFYARAMQNHGWLLTHQGIAFSTDGIGIDLQHRLEAIKLAGVEVAMMVTEGLDSRAFEAIDQHERRSISDALRLDRSLTEEAKMMLMLMGGDMSTNPSLHEIAETCGDIEHEHDQLQQACSTRVAGMSALSVRCAAIVLMLEQPSESVRVMQSYRDLVLRKTEVWTPVMHAFGRQVAAKKTGSSTTAARLDLFARAMVALDPGRARLSKIQINEASIELARKRVRAAMGLKHAKEEA
jgi:hypothetical protein